MGGKWRKSTHRSEAANSQSSWHEDRSDNSTKHHPESPLLKPGPNSSFSISSSFQKHPPQGSYHRDNYRNRSSHLPQGSNHDSFIVKSQRLKRSIMKSLDYIRLQVEQWYPDDDSSGDSMEWQYEDERLIHHSPLELVHAWGQPQCQPAISGGLCGGLNADEYLGFPDAKRGHFGDGLGIGFGVERGRSWNDFQTPREAAFAVPFSRSHPAFSSDSTFGIS